MGLTEDMLSQRDWTGFMVSTSIAALTGLFLAAWFWGALI